MNKIKEKEMSGKTAFGAWMQIPSGDIAEIVAREDYDFCTADMEHSEITNAELVNIFRGLRGSNCLACARVASNEKMKIRAPLDLGANVLIVPLVNSAEEARRAVSFAKYPPDGVRGYAFCRANNWSSDFNEYVKNSNDDVLLLAMIETKTAVENIDEILSVDGIDGVFVGPYDMSGSYGIVGDLQNEIVKNAIRKVVEACKRHDKIAGQHITHPTPENIREAIAQGYRFLALGIDALYLVQSLHECRKIAEESSWSGRRIDFEKKFGNL